MFRFARMRKRTIVIAIAAAAVGIAAGVDGAVGVIRSSNFDRASAALRATWQTDAADGVPSASLEPLRQQLDRRQPSTSWWSPVWIRTGGRQLIADLQSQTDAAWSGAMASARQRAQSALDAYISYAAGEAGWIPADISAAARGWPRALSTASTPAALAALAREWRTTLVSTQGQVEAAKTAHFTALLQSSGGRSGLLATAQNLVTTARGDNLDSGDVHRLMPAVTVESDSGQPPTPADEALLTAVDALQSLIDLNNTISDQMVPTYYTTLQAQAEATPSAGAFASRYQGVISDFHSGTTTAQLTSVETRLTALQAAMSSELQAHDCGYPVPSGKAITINLTVQEMLFYQDGCVVNAAPVTTGRPALPTPTGSFHVFYKQTNFIMHSSWPKGSPFWYPDSLTHWVMEFNGGGYFIHDAPWQNQETFGPGSENQNWSASHGCVHTPSATMQWAYDWTPIGTPVLISR